jgi:hypothetical protein
MGDFRQEVNSYNQNAATRPLTLYFVKGNVAPTTTTADTAIGDLTVTLTDATGFVDGTYVGLFSGGGNFYFGTQIGAPAGNVITLDTPIDAVFLAGANALSSSKDVNVNGDITPQTFQIGTPGSGIEIDITRITGFIQGAGTMDDAKFGDRVALPKGLVLRRVDGTTINLWNVHSNGELALVCASDLDYTTRSPGGSSGLRFRNTYNGQDKHDTVIRLCPGDTLELIVQDDLSTLEIFNVMAQGREISP